MNILFFIFTLSYTSLDYIFFFCIRNMIKMSIQLSDNQSTNTYNLLSFLMSASISANYFSYPYFLLLSPVVSTNLTWVIFWYSLLISFHFLLRPSLISFTYSSLKHCLNGKGNTFNQNFVGVKFESFCILVVYFLWFCSSSLVLYRILAF
jgi:hypothetical protein